MCLIVSQVTDSVNYFMRPGDFDKADIGWKTGAKDTIPAEQVKGLVAKKQVEPKKSFDGIPPQKPIYPGNRVTINKVTWDFFWDNIMATGRVNHDALVAHVLANTPKKMETKARISLRDLPSLITTRSGYLIRKNEGDWIVFGKGRGGKGLIGEPFSTESYRKIHGFS
jgi:hypothetical protein